ncbi:hypothetical protein L3Q82_019716 [Scortum barcoo]|uniref:Uncharacterized protein n=1 Tax=Scortum barcoo TaxID=214431 RepID=A0ACB8VCI8_9TELE|nr:hypothetical protein L3Q82_019716 [Scortum barcoo]
MRKVPSAAARLAKLPVVRSACIKLSVLYIDTKRCHPNLKSVCEVLESSVTAIGDRASPVMVKLQPQSEYCQATLLTFTMGCGCEPWIKEIVTTAKNKMHEIQDVVSIAANGTVDCVQHTVTWLMGQTQQGDDQATDQPLVERVIRVASVGLDSALILSEALIDRVLPPTEQDQEEAARLLEGFVAAKLRRSYSVRLVSVATKLCRRTFHMVESKMQSVQVIETLSRSSGLVKDLQSSWLTVAWSIQGLPQYVQHQLVSVFFFVSQMYNLGCPPSQQYPSHQDRKSLNAAEISTYKDVVPVRPPPTPTCRMRRATLKSEFENGCNVKGCVRR